MIQPVKILEREYEKLAFIAREAKRKLMKTDPNDKALQEDVAWAQHEAWKLEQRLQTLRRAAGGAY